LNDRADVRALKLEHGSDGLRLMVAGPGFNGWITSPLIGEYNASNILAAVSTAVTGLGLEFDVVGQGIALMPSIPGRMERIDLGADFTAIVDFAHTPNALQRALLAAKDLAQHSSPSGRVIAVFGSAGLRDRQKRRMMAEISADLADISVLTAEDPRSESLTAILEEMAEGARSRGSVEKRDFVRIPDRREAIRYAVSIARPGDMVIALGKGHEQSMCFGETEYPWDDRVAMRAALSEHLGLDGPEMPYLPDPLEIN
jgi:UDP-N-acetylmuramoyl-L-alanyl-D-glutamate--2,6-diaminopimelate ligase